MFLREIYDVSERVLAESLDRSKRSAYALMVAKALLMNCFMSPSLVGISLGPWAPFPFFEDSLVLSVVWWFEELLRSR